MPRYHSHVLGVETRTSSPPNNLKPQHIYCHAIVDGTSDSHNQVLGELLTLGLLYIEFTDAVNFIFPLFKIFGRTNYMIETFTMLYSHAFSPCQAEQLLWCRLILQAGQVKIPTHGTFESCVQKFNMCK